MHFVPPSILAQPYSEDGLAEDGLAEDGALVSSHVVAASPCVVASSYDVVLLHVVASSYGVASSHVA